MKTLWQHWQPLVIRMAVTAAALLALGCKPSVEGETRAWDQNKLTLQEWSGKFANFKPAIEGRIAEAQRDFDAAKVLSDADARAAKMREANDKLYALTTAFQEIDRKVKEYDTLKNDPALLRLQGMVLMPAMQASENIMRAARMRMDGPVANAGEALGRLRDASAGIDNAMRPLQDLRSRANAQPAQGQPGTLGQPGMPGQPGMGGQPQMPGQPLMPGQVGLPPTGAMGGAPMGMRPTMGVPPSAGMPGGAPMPGQMGPGGAGGAMQPQPGAVPGAGMRPMGPAGAAPMGTPGSRPPGAPPNGPVPPSGPAPAGAKPF